jgi:hypothetical protein
MTREEYEGFWELHSNIVQAGFGSDIAVPEFALLPRGAIVGTVEIVDCVSRSGSPWFFGDYGFVLKDPIALPEPIECKGALGFWDVSSEMERSLK